MGTLLLFLWLPISFGAFPFLYLLLRYGYFKVALWGVLVFFALGLPLLLLKGENSYIVASIYWSSYPIAGYILYKGLLSGWFANRLYLWMQIPVVLCGVFLFLVFQSNPEHFKTFLLSASSEWLGSVDNVDPELQRSLENSQKMLFNLFPGIVVADFSIRLIAGVGILRWLDWRKKISLGIPEFRAIYYSDWPIWILITGLLGCVLGLYQKNVPVEVLWGAGCILIGIVPYYFLRGFSVCSHWFFLRKGEKPLSLPGKIFLFLLILFVPIWAYVFISVVSLGILDTWFGWRSRTVPLNH